MDVMDFFVITGLGVYHTHLYVVDIHHAVMDLMKQIVVRDLKLCVFLHKLYRIVEMFGGKKFGEFGKCQKPSKRHMQVTKQWDCTSIRQTFFCHIIFQINFTKHYHRQTFPLYGI